MSFFISQTIRKRGNVTQKGLHLWLDASRGITLNGGNVAQWDDQSGNNYHCSQSDSLIQPTYVSAGINGLPSVRLVSASSTNLYGAGTNLPQDVFSVFVVSKLIYYPGTYGWILSAGFGDSWNMTYVSNSIAWWPHGGVSYNLFTTVATTAAPNLITLTHDDVAATTNFYNNSVADGIVYDITWKALGGYYVGTQRAAYCQGDMDISEIIIYDRLVTASEKTSIEAYLNQKYAIY